MSKKLSGYTLTEMIAVLSITSIMAGAAIPAIEAMRNEAADIRARKDIRLLQTLAEQYFQKNGRYPATLAEIHRHSQDPYRSGKNYEYEIGVVGNRPFFVIYTPGHNRAKDFQLADAQWVNLGDDVVGSNFPVADDDAP
jgi:prepilin-type N-terminal cleavage/methylation domain-containing protein